MTCRPRTFKIDNDDSHARPQSLAFDWYLGKSLTIRQGPGDFHQSRLWKLKREKKPLRNWKRPCTARWPNIDKQCFPRGCCRSRQATFHAKSLYSAAARDRVWSSGSSLGREPKAKHKRAGGECFEASGHLHTVESLETDKAFEAIRVKKRP